MLTSFMGSVLCCLTGKPANVVVPAETSCSEPADGYEFVEVKPGRVLRVRHVARQRPGGTPGADEGPAGTAIGCRRKITVYRNGQLLIENLGESAKAEMKSCQANGKAPSAALEVDDPGNPSRHPEVKPQGRTADATAPPCGQGTEQQQQQQQPTRVLRRKPKRTVVIDCERRISSCKGSHADLALFFVHGVGGSLDIWGRQLDFFSREGYEVIAPDLVGHGASSAPRIAAAYTFYALAEDMRVIFRRYARKRNILIGHSYGVSFCTFLAHEYPDQVHKMVMINGGGPTALEPSLCSIFNLPTCVLHCLAPLLTWSFLKAGFARQGPSERQLLREHGAFSAPSFVLRATMGGQYWPEGDEAYHAEITVPTLLVHGMCDKFVPVEEDQRMAEILLLAFLKILDDGSHMVMMECPEAVNTLLHEFFLWEPEPQPSKEPKVPPDTAAMVAPDDAQPSSA